MATLLDILQSGGAGPATGPGESLLDELLRRRQSAVPGQTPGFNPNAPPPGDIFAQAQQGNFGTSAPTSRVPQRQIDRTASGEGLSLADQILGRLGKPGRALMPVSNFLGSIGDAFRGAAERGTLGSVAPQFQAGVQRSQQIQQGADRNDINRRFVEAQIEALSRPETQPTPKASTDRGKVLQDFNNGLITEDQRDARLNEINATERRKENQDASALRSERDKVIGGTTEALQSLRAAESLLNADNPFADVASLTSFIRSIDNSVVRPSEQANFDAALGLVDQIEGIWQRARGEGALTPSARKALRESIQALRENYEAIQDGQEEFFKKEAEAAGVEPSRVLRGSRPPPIEDDFDPSKLSTEELRRIAAGDN